VLEAQDKRDWAETQFAVGNYFGRGQFKRRILDVKHLSNGWFLLRTEDSKTPNDFRVRTVYQLEPRPRSLTPKHAHFMIDFFGKLREDHDKGMKVFQAIIDVWNGKDIAQTLKQYQSQVEGLYGYKLEYILYALDWILKQEDINFQGRPAKKQEELNETMKRSNVTPLQSRLGSHLAISLLCNVAQGMHPVEAFIRAQLDVIPVKRARGAK
jgi:hypothetical protein